jgi:hypothetical protein
MKKFLLLVLLFSIMDSAYSQLATHRFRFQHRISKKKLAKLSSAPAPLLYITDASGNKYDFCQYLKKPFKCIVTYDASKRTLLLDSWAIIPNDTQCQTAGIINSTTPNTLQIKLPDRNKIGDKTVAVRLPYRTWVLGVNALAFKLRPKVKDYSGNNYTPSAITSGVNLGITIGHSFGWTNFRSNNLGNNSFSLTPAFSLGFSSASLSKEPLKKQVVVTYNPSNLILSPAASLIIARNDIGIILSFGKECMTGKNSSAWAYQGKGYFGLGIAAGLKL